eukprot:4434446-Pyramimonas_sp.AAC.1
MRTAISTTTVAITANGHDRDNRDGDDDGDRDYGGCDDSDDSVRPIPPRRGDHGQPRGGDGAHLRDGPEGDDDGAGRAEAWRRGQGVQADQQGQARRVAGRAG